jgi:hypothetical protein
MSESESEREKERYRKELYLAEYGLLLEQAQLGRCWLDRKVTIPAAGRGRREALCLLAGRAAHQLEQAEATLEALGRPRAGQAGYRAMWEDVCVSLRAARDALRELCSGQP